MMRGSWGHGPRPTCPAIAASLGEQRRGIKTFNQRDLLVFGMPIEFSQYQRHTNNPMKASGVQFNTHFKDHVRSRDKSEGAFVDYLHWGKTLGQAHMPHRHQRVAFDHHDTMQPTALPSFAKKGWFENQDPTAGEHPDLDSKHDPKRLPWNTATNFNRMYTDRQSQAGRVLLNSHFRTENMTRDVIGITDTGSENDFGHTTVDDGHSTWSYREREHPQFNQQGVVPGIHAPYLGEPDRKMMEAMSQPTRVVSEDPKRCNAVTENVGRYSRHIYLNEPAKGNTMTGAVCRQLTLAIDSSTTALRTKMVVLKGAQSGLTDVCNGGMNLDDIAFQLLMADARATEATLLLAQRDAKGVDAYSRKQLDVRMNTALEDAAEYRDRADSAMRDGVSLLWSVFAAARPLMTLINGKCHNVGNGVALLSKYPALRDSTELVHDGPQHGVTPFGGMTHLLARTETSLKYPGLAEFVMLTGTPLYSGDALRLGWSDLFSTIPDIDFHIREWFDSTEHMHNDAIAWQIGHLLETCFEMKQQHSTALERTALTPTRAKWVEELFADQPSVEAILATLGEVEKLPLSDPANTADANQSGGASLSSVDDGIEKLRLTKMHYTLTPWDITAPADDVPVKMLSEVFQSYFFERGASQSVVSRTDNAKLRRWQKHRANEYKGYQINRQRACPRHVFVRLEGCEGKVVDFPFAFDKVACEAAVHAESDEDKMDAMLRVLKAQAAEALGMPRAELAVQWNLPTLDTAPVLRDDELTALLHADPGVENSASPTARPPIYLVAVRPTLHMSEWAYSVKHHLLMMCPMALKASFALLNAVRGDGTAEQVKSVSDSLSLEYRYASRMMRRRDFFAVGRATARTPEQWAADEERVGRNVHEAALPLRPVVSHDEVFDRDVTIDGHRFVLRPKWQHRTVADVPEREVAALAVELDFEADGGLTEIHPPTQKNMAERVGDTVLKGIGYEVVARLGDKAASGSDAVPPLVSDAVVPDNVNFYEMARHPWKDTPTSWRSHGFTEGSEQYFKKQYDAAVKAVHDPNDQGAHHYWPQGKGRDSAAAAAAEPAADSAAVLLQDRFWGAIDKANKNVESWARETRSAAEQQSLKYRLEIATTDEKIMDDEYYRWFVRPGEHPNPSGILRSGGGKKAQGTDE
jgi:enoyl-CoA hydratase/carnithine racemase